MPVLLQVCLVIVTTAVTVIAIVTVRAMTRFEKVATEFQHTAQAARASLAEVQVVTHELRELVSSVSEVVPRFRTIVNRFEDLGERTAQMSSDLLEEVEAPVRTAVAIVRGVRRGTSTLFDRLMQKFAHRQSPTTNGGIQP